MLGRCQNSSRRLTKTWWAAPTALALTVVAVAILPGTGSRAQAPTGPTMLDPNLQVETVVEGLNQPTSMAFIGPDDFLVLEKASGQVKRVTSGVVQGVVLDLPVNSASERGLLGIAVHPRFPRDPGVYLYWTESSTGADSANLADVPVLGNRVDRFEWDGATLTHDLNLIRLRSFQADADQPLRGNHNGGVIRFAPLGNEGRGRGRGRHDRGGRGRRERAKLFIIIGDNGRRGQTQNLLNGPFGPGIPDDQFGGPEPDDEHLTGVVLRLNDDGTTPSDNPFFRAGARIGGEVGANIQKIFAYGVRNSFGMAVDPRSGDLWTQENGDDSFDELNRVTPGQNGGWVQIMGPVSRIAEFKAIETSPEFFGLQQVRWPPTNIADTPGEALSRLVRLPGSHYSDPEFSWKFAVAPAGIGFLNSRALGRQYEGDLFVGAARTFLENGYLFRFNLTGNRRNIAVTNAAVADRVADNAAKFTITESEEFLIGRNFGIGTDIITGPNGNLFVVSLSNGAVYEISRS